MDRLGDATARRALVLLGAFIVVGGFALALLSNISTGTFSPTQNQGNFGNVAGGPYSPDVALSSLNGNVGQAPQSWSQVVTTQTTYMMSTTTQGSNGNPVGGLVHYTNVSSTGSTQGSPTSGGGLLEFSSQVNLQSAQPQQTASDVVALAYTVGGYVAYQSTYPDSANVVIRVPAAQYQSTLSKVEALGKVTYLASNSNDVRVQYTDLNATLASLRTEQGALLKLLNQSTNINSTLAIESQLQGVDAQINDVESQILQTATLINYSTINVNIGEAPVQVKLTSTLSATPTKGTAPLSVTFNTVAKGGVQPYYFNYNFGDGYASQGQIVIHTFGQGGDYNVSVSVTDSNGTVAQSFVVVHANASPQQIGTTNFFGTIANLFVSVVEGIVEVAVVVLPLAAVGAVIVIPMRRRGRAQKELKQSQ